MDLQSRKSPYIIGAIFVVFSLIVLGVSLAGQLRGDMFFHIQPSGFFGIPEVVKEKGHEEPLFVNGSGWDGQFHYYIANDLNLSDETASHIDNPVYRYARIGLPLASKILSVVTLQSYVTPTTYYLTSFLAILAALIFMGRFFLSKGASPYILLAWALSFGVQFTFLRALPDPFADAIAMIALVCLFNRHYALFSLFIFLAALSRETYILLAAGVFTVHLVQEYRRFGFTLLKSFAFYKHFIILGLPGALLIGWQIYLKARFGILPAESGGVQGALISPYPLMSWFEEFVKHLAQGTQMAGANQKQAFFMLFGLALIAMLAIASFKAMLSLFASFKRGVAEESLEIEAEERESALGVAIGFLAIALTLSSMGPVVFFDFQNYLKSLAVAMYAVPLLILFIPSERRKNIQAWGYAVMIAVCLVSLPALYKRTKGDFLGEHSQHSPQVFAALPDAVPCLSHYQSKIEFLSVREGFKGHFSRAIFRKPDVQFVKVRVTNMQAEDYISAKGIGTTNLGAQWIKEGLPPVDIARVILPPVLKAGTSFETEIPVTIKRKWADRTLRISPVQDGCSWHYNHAQGGRADLKIDDGKITTIEGK